MATREWRVDWLTRDGWAPLFWFHNQSTARDAFARWARFHHTRLIHLANNKAELIEESV